MKEPIYFHIFFAKNLHELKFPIFDDRIQYDCNENTNNTFFEICNFKIFIIIKSKKKESL